MIVLLMLAAFDDPQVPPAQLQARKVEIEKQASAAVRGALAPICLGRCELLGVDVEVEVVKKTSEEMPGFDRLAKSAVEVQAKSIVAHIAADQKLTPQTRTGLSQAVQSSLVGMAPTVDVKLRPFDFPQPRNEAASPIIISMSKTDSNDKAAVQALPPPPPPAAPPPPTPLERLLGALADGAPWLLGLVLLFLGLGWLVWLRRPPAPAEQEAQARETSDTSEAQTKQPLHSELLALCGQNRALRAAVTRHVLEDARLYRCLPLLGPEALADFHNSDLAGDLPRAYAAMRTSKEPPIAELEGLIAEVMEQGEPDPRFYQLQTIDGPVFSAVVRALGDDDGKRVLMRAPARLRKAHLAGLRMEERQAFYSAALDVSGQLTTDALDALAARLANEIADKRVGYQLALQAAADMGDEHDAEQARIVGAVLQKKPLWSQLAAEQVVSEQQILEAPDEVIDSLLIGAPPEIIVAFLRGAGAELKLRIQGKLPGYLKSLLVAEQGRTVTDEELQRARTAVFRAFRRIRRQAVTVEAQPQAKVAK